MTTRFEHINNMVATAGEWDAEDLARRILAVADKRTYWSVRDVATFIGRPSPTVATWVIRGTHDVPTAIGAPASGAIWDAADWHTWAEDHRALCQVGSAGWKLANDVHNR